MIRFALIDHGHGHRHIAIAQPLHIFERLRIRGDIISRERHIFSRQQGLELLAETALGRGEDFNRWHKKGIKKLSTAFSNQRGIPDHGTHEKSKREVEKRLPINEIAEKRDCDSTENTDDERTGIPVTFVTSEHFEPGDEQHGNHEGHKHLEGYQKTEASRGQESPECGNADRTRETKDRGHSAAKRCFFFHRKGLKNRGAIHG